MASYLIFAGKVDDVNKVQTLLFSATLPSWVKQVCTYVIISCSKFVVCADWVLYRWSFTSSNKFFVARFLLNF